MKILTVNGIESDGSASTDRLGDALRKLGYDVIDVNQPRRHVWDARWYLKKDAAYLASLANDGDIIVAHSYGCLKAAVANRKVRFRAMFLYRPAMNRRFKFASHRHTAIYCIYSPRDFMVLLGGLLRFKHPFGWAGFLGFTDPLVTHVRSHGRHSHDFHGEHIQHQASFIDGRIRLSGHRHV